MIAEIAAGGYNERDTYRVFYDKDEEQVDYKEYINSLNSKLLERINARNPRLWDKYMKN